MRGIFVYLPVLLLFLNACADRPKPPSPEDFSMPYSELRLIENNPGATDTINVKAFIDIAQRLCDTEPDSVQRMMKKVIRQAFRKHQYSVLGHAFNILGTAQFNMRQLEQSKYSFTRALDYFPYCDSGKMYTPLVYSNLGNVFVMMEWTDSALHCYRKALSLLGNALESPSVKISIYNGMAGCMVAAELYSQATGYIEKSMEIARRTNRKDDLAYCYGMLGAILQKKDPDSAIYYYRQSWYLYRSIGSKIGEQSVLRHIGSTWILKKEADSAEYYYNLSERILPLESKTYFAGLIEKANIALIRKDYAKALSYYKRAEQDLIPTALAENALVLYRNIASVYKALNKDLQAYQYMTAYYRLKDSIFNEQKMATVNRLNMQFHLAEKDRSLLSKQLMITRQNAKIQKQYLGMAVSVILVLVLLIILYRRKHRITLVGIHAKLAGAEQERLRLAQEIHDGIVSKLTSVKMNFNALPEYDEELPARQFHETLQYLDASISELRQTTHNLHPALLQHVGLLNAITSLITQVNMGGLIKLRATFSGILPTLSATSELHLYRIIQELIQNILKHATASDASLQLTCEGDRLDIEIGDNGKGLDDDIVLNRPGVGLNNIRDRVQLLKGIIDIHGGKDGTVARLHFSIRNLREFV